MLSSALSHAGPVSIVLLIVGFAYYATAIFSDYTVAAVTMSAAIFVGVSSTLVVVQIVRSQMRREVREFWFNPRSERQRHLLEVKLGELTAGEQLKALQVVLRETDLSRAQLRELLRDDGRDVNDRIEQTLTALLQSRRRQD